MLATMIGADSKVLFIDELEQHLGKKEQKNLLTILLLFLIENDFSSSRFLI